jgi:hypothetical protein
MSSQPAAGDKRSALNAPDTDDDDGCAEQGEGAEAAGPNPEQAGTRNKKLRRNGEARNLSPLEERKTVWPSYGRSGRWRYEEQTGKAGAWSKVYAHTLPLHVLGDKISVFDIEGLKMLKLSQNPHIILQIKVMKTDVPMS